MKAPRAAQGRKPIEKRRRTPTTSTIENLQRESLSLAKHGEKKTEKDKIPCAPKSLDKRGREEWTKLAAILHPVGLLTPLDHMSLAIYCDAISVWHKAGEELKKAGNGIIKRGKGGAGGMYRNPWFDVRAKAEEKIYKYASLFGLSPADRARMKSPQDPRTPSNPFDKI